MLSKISQFIFEFILFLFNTVIIPSQCYNIMTCNVWIMSFYVDDTGSPLKHDINWCNVASTKSMKNHNFSQVAIRGVDSNKHCSCLLTLETTWNIFRLVSGSHWQHFLLKLLHGNCRRQKKNSCEIAKTLMACLYWVWWTIWCVLRQISW